MHRNWSYQKVNPALKTKAQIKSFSPRLKYFPNDTHLYDADISWEKLFLKIYVLLFRIRPTVVEDKKSETKAGSRISGKGVQITMSRFGLIRTRHISQLPSFRMMIGWNTISNKMSVCFNVRSYMSCVTNEKT